MQAVGRAGGRTRSRIDGRIRGSSEGEKAMQSYSAGGRTARARVVAVASTLVLIATGGVAVAQELEEIVVTAQKREVGLQDAPLSISAFSGDTLEKARILDAGDLAYANAGLTFTNPTPFDMELNIRGVMNTRLDAPSASRSVGTFVDEVVVGRMGLMNMNFFDIERVEILRGPQGVLLGKNVVGGAINIITAKPEFERSGQIMGSVGNLDSRLINGHYTGGITDNIAVRAAFQYKEDDGFAENWLNGTPYHDLESLQARLSFLYEGDNDLRANLILEYMTDEGNGTCAIGEFGNPWAVAREVVGITDIRECLPEPVQYSNAPPGGRLQGFDREATSLNLTIDKGFSGFTLTSITGYRSGNGESQYSQTGLGPDAPGIQEAFFGALGSGDIGRATSLGLAFDFPVRELEDLSQFSQELRVTSTSDGRLDWIAGAYYQKDEVDKFDRFWSEILLGAVGLAPGSLNGESVWDNRGEVESYAFFGQVGYQILDPLKFTIGARYTNDDISGNIRGTAVRTGDKFAPDDPVPLTPLTGEPDGAGGINFYPQGGGFMTPYSESWSEMTLQGILEWTLSDAIMVYGSIAEGYKSGGFQDTPPNTLGATLPYEPETVTNYEAGIKSEFFGGRMRLNGAVFYMDYSDLQVEFTNDVCLCNVVSNASDAKIQGIEFEIQAAPIDSLLVWFNGTVLDTEYEDYVISTGDFSGNQLQRTPETQLTAGAEYSMDIGGWEDGLAFRVNYAWQDEMPWAHTNVSWEDSYGLLDARVSLAPVDSAWSVSVWGKNLTDEDVRANVIEFLGGDVGLYAPPRTYGVDLTWRFE
jgi:iron complex outermembrane receptor protein